MEIKEGRIFTGSFDLDKWLNGGYETDIITTIYGPAGSGKTNFCISAAVSACKEKKVIFIDTEGGFSIERFKQIAGESYKSFLSNLLILKPTSFSEQKKDFSLLLKNINEGNIGLIIVDGMTMLYRLELADACNSSDEFRIRLTNKELAKQLRILSEIARKKNIPILITNQIYYDFLSKEDFQNGKEKKANMVGGDLLKYWSKCLIELQNNNGKRKALLVKHRNIPEGEFAFSIGNSGIKRRGIFEF
ncbi:MAG: DNA repair and recombination protein RadB [Candidatus Pacearchaeota archaeon]